MLIMVNLQPTGNTFTERLSSTINILFGVVGESANALSTGLKGTIGMVQNGNIQGATPRVAGSHFNDNVELFADEDRRTTHQKFSGQEFDSTDVRFKDAQRKTQLEFQRESELEINSHTEADIAARNQPTEDDF